MPGRVTRSATEVVCQVPSLYQGSLLALHDWTGQSSSHTAAVGLWLGMNESTEQRGAVRHAPGDTQGIHVKEPGTE